MLDTTQAVVEFLSALAERDGRYFDFAGSYGEPGYTTDGETPLVVLGDYWCRCREIGDDMMHDVAAHYPKAFARMEANGVEFEWHDEWIVDSENDKAYRTQADSYQWQPSYVLSDDGEMLTADDDVEAWVQWAVNDPSRCIPSRVYSGKDLEAVGFVLYNAEHSYENGWHPHQTDDPKTVSDAVRRDHGDVDVVFALDETSQFYIGFSAYYRHTCIYCGEAVTQDSEGSWVDTTGGDGCDSGVHQGTGHTD